MTLWERRDLPVLRAIHELGIEPHGTYLHLGQGEGKRKLGVDLADADVELAIVALGDASYVSGRHDGDAFMALAVTGRGMQVLREWPYFTDLTPATVAALLDRFAEEAPTEEESNNARRAAKYIRSLPETTFKAVLKTVMVEGAKAAIRLSAG